MSLPTTVDLPTELRRWARSAYGYVRSVMGADAYERYLDRAARTRPGQPVLSERDFWREYQDWQDRAPQGRCC